MHIEHWQVGPDHLEINILTSFRDAAALNSSSKILYTFSNTCRNRCTYSSDSLALGKSSQYVLQ